MNRVVHWIRRAAPPIAFGAWVYKVYRRFADPAIPAFGPVDPLLARLQSELFADLCVAFLLLAAWIVLWAGPRRLDERPSAPHKPRGAKRRLSV